MLEKIKNHLPKVLDLAKSLQDVQMLGLIMFAVTALLISWSGVKVIETNYRLQKDIARLQQENEVRRLKNRNLELENEYYKTNEYLDLQARKNFGLAAPGETVLVVPKHVAMRYVEPGPAPAEQAELAAKKKPQYQQNFEAWMDFLFRRSEPER